MNERREEEERRKAKKKGMSEEKWKVGAPQRM